MQKLHNILKAPYHFQWLILFFVIHSYSEFVGLIQLSSLLLLIVQISAAGWVLFFLFRKMYRDTKKAALLVTVLVFFYLFFSALQEGLAAHKITFKWSLFARLLPVMFLLSMGTLVGLFKYKRSTDKINRFLNAVFLTLALYDFCSVIWQATNLRSPQTPVVAKKMKPLADTSAKPDVYLIIMDEYLGTAGLQEYYHYNNSTFETYLKEKGFHINSTSQSNYPATIYSMASMLNMRYLDPVAELGKSKGFAYKNMMGLINHNDVVECFKQFHYSIHNYSAFALDNVQPNYYFSTMPRDVEMITFRMLYTRIVRRLVYAPPQNYIDLSRIANYYNKKVAATHENQMAEMLNAAGKQSPSFSYLHLIMPHKPFMYDSTGKLTNTYKAIKGDKQSGTDALYLQYLVYTNKRMMQYLDQLFAATQGKAVIMVMSDHGYRDLYDIGGKFFGFTNFNAVYLPNRDYHLWYDSVSNVNQFPLLFNTLFGQQLPLKKDSTVHY